MPVFAKDSEVYDAVSDLQSKVDRLWEKTGLAAEDKKAADAQAAADKKAEEDAAKAEQQESEPAPTTEPRSEPAKVEEKPTARGGAGSGSR